MELTDRAGTRSRDVMGMVYRLSVLKYKGQPPQGDLSAIFDENGGSLGRSADNRLVLEDPEKYVSRHHASIRHEGGQYFLADSSLAGTVINDAPAPLHNAEVPLTDGMVLKMGEYEILVEAVPPQTVVESPLSEFPEPSPFGPEPTPFRQPPAQEEQLGPDFDFFQPETLPEERGIAGIEGGDSSALPEEEEDFSSLLSEKFVPDRDETPPESPLEVPSSVLQDSFVPPGPDSGVAPYEQIPEDFDFEDLFECLESEGERPGGAPPEVHIPPPLEPGPDTSEIESQPPASATFEKQPPSVAESEPAEAAAPPQASAVSENVEAPRPARAGSGASVPSGGEAVLFRAFLKGAGIDRLDFADHDAEEMMRTVGVMFRSFVEGLMAVLRSRAEFKSQFRVSMTTIRPVDNNPLKFSTSVEEACRHLFIDRSGAFLPPEIAVDEGFRDIMDHQLAMTAGIQASLGSLLKRMDPKAFERQFEQGIVLQKKSKCWEAYTEAYPKFLEEAAEDFFGDAFAEAYEEQMRVLKSAGKK